MSLYNKKDIPDHLRRYFIKPPEIGSEPSPDCGTHGQAQCVDPASGGEPGSGCFICRMVRVFREVRRVLRDDGTLWLNLGDSYTSGGRSDYGPSNGKQQTNVGSIGISRLDARLPSGNLVGVPWRVALALQADGWVLRQDIVWSKPSPMPESVRSRCTKAHEYVFLLTKLAKYYYDAEAIKEKSEQYVTDRILREATNGLTNEYDPTGYAAMRDDGGVRNKQKGAQAHLAGSRNKRSVWTIPAQGYPGAHFATYPPKLIEPMILAGTSAHGCCAGCGAPWRRVISETKLTRERPNDYVKRNGAAGTGNSCANTVAEVASRTVGWKPTCTCNGRFEKGVREIRRMASDYRPDSARKQDALGDRTEVGFNARWDAAERGDEGEVVEKTTTIYVSDLPLDEHPVVPCVVLDPFIGSGTTAEVCVEHGRRCWGIDLSAQYLEKNAVPRAQGALLARPATAWLAGGVPSGPGEVDGAADLAEEL